MLSPRGAGRAGAGGGWPANAGNGAGIAGPEAASRTCGSVAKVSMLPVVEGNSTGAAGSRVASNAFGQEHEERPAKRSMDEA